MSGIYQWLVQHVFGNFINHWGSIGAVLLALSVDIKGIFPSVANNSVYKAINNILQLFFSKSKLPEPTPTSPTPPTTGH